MKPLKERVDETFPKIKALLDENKLDIDAEPFIDAEGRLRARPRWIEVKAEEPTEQPNEETKE